MKRRKTIPLWVGKVQIGGQAPISVQSMTNTDTRNVEATVAQIKRLEAAGCELVRVAVPDEEAARVLGNIKRQINTPLIADIHFDYRLALEALKQGVDGLRLNPGNIGSMARVTKIVELAKEREVPIRIGVNAGSLEKNLLDKHGGPTAEAMVESALQHVALLEKLGYHRIKISLKASDIPLMLKAYTLLAHKVEYPFHIGVTEAGPLRTGTIKSACGVGALLAYGLGDTLRISLTGAPEQEVGVAYEILKAFRLRQKGPELISCPTCGRCQIDLISVAEKVEKAIADIEMPIKVAVMGCAVNGPGEAREADIGIAGGKGGGLLFKKGEIVAKIPSEQMVEVLLKEIRHMVSDKHEL